MTAEFFSIFRMLFFVAACGLSLSAAVMSCGRLSWRAAALAPSAGLALFGFLGFALYRYVGPLSATARPAALALVALSTAVLIAGHALSRRLPDAAELRRVAVGTACVLGVAALAAAPLLAGGIQFAAFQTNPSDAFFFQSFAASIRAVDWATLAEGSGTIAELGEGVKRLAAEAPTALYTARFLKLPLTLGNSAALAWVTKLAELEVHRFYFCYNLICLIAAFPASFVLARECGLARAGSFLAAAAVTLGYWGHYVLLSDGSAQIYTVPVSIFLAVMWIRKERRIFSPAHLVCAVALAAILASNPAFPPMLAPAFLFYYGSALLFRRLSVPSMLGSLAVGAIAIGLLAATGQADYLLACYKKFFYFVQSRTYAYDPGVFAAALGKNFFTGAWGFRPFVEGGALAAILKPIAVLSGAVLSGVLAVFTARGLGRDASAARRVVASLIVASWTLSACALLTRNYFSAIRAFEYAYPFFTIAAASYCAGFRAAARGAGGILGKIAAIWLLSQCALGVLWIGEAARLSSPGADSMKPETYDAAPILAALDERGPRLLYVNVPPEKTWFFPIHAQLVFARFPSHYAQGNVYDNRLDGIHKLFDLEAMPDYAVTTRDADFIGPRRLGKPVAQTGSLILYEITGGTLADFTGAQP